MLDSKAIDLDKFEYKWYEQVWDFFFNNKVIKLSYWHERIKKNIRFYWNVLRFDYDFDSHGYLLMLNYKFTELQRVLENGYAVQESKDMQALRICIKLTKRLWDDEYDMRAWRKAEEKFGKHNFRFESIEGSTNSRWISSYGGDESEETQQAAHKYKIKFYEVAQKCRERDERNLYAIMLKHRRHWWD